MSILSTPELPFFATLPGSNRKRTPQRYNFRMTYRNPRLTERGCLMTWLVIGGRSDYQIAIERVNEQLIRWHCSCADATYRGHRNPFYYCKHVHALQHARWK